MRDLGFRKLQQSNDFWIVLALTALSVCLFARACGNGFVNYDDPGFILKNRQVQVGLTWPGLAWAFTTLHMASWHPLTWISFQLDYQFYGLNAWGFHLTNLILHVLCTVLLFYALRRLGAGAWRSGLVAGLFAFHPLHVESVAWISERKDVLSTLFWILAIIAYAAYIQRPGPARYCVVLLLFALGLLAKSMLVTLPFVLLLLDYWPLRRFGWPRAAARSHGGDRRFQLTALGRCLLEKAPLLVLALASCNATMIAQARRGAVNTLDQLPARMENALLAYVSYLAKTVWPSGLAAFYPYPLEDYAWWKVAAAALFLAGVTGVTFALRRRYPYLLFGWLWYLGTLVPVIGLVQILGGHSMADRYTYIPLIGIFIAIVWRLADWLEYRRVPESVRAGVAALILISLMSVSWVQIGYWRDSLTLWHHALACTSGSWMAHSNLGHAWREAGNLQAAVPHLREAIRLHPRCAPAHRGLGAALAVRRQHADAIEHFRKAAEIEPTDGMGQFYLGQVLLESGRFDEAEAALLKAERLLANAECEADIAEVHIGLGIISQKAGRHKDAIVQYRQALRINPGSPVAHNNLGAALVSEGALDEAKEHFRAVLRIQPANAQAQQNLLRLQARRVNGHSS